MNPSLKQFYFLKSALFAVALFLCFGTPAFAHADNINVVFQATPLFSDANIAPGYTVTRSVTVTNTSGAAQDVYVKVINGVSTGSLGDKLLLTVTDGDTTPMSNVPLSTIIGGASQLIGSGLADGATDTYNFSVYFDSSAGNDYQNSTLGFDLCVGFAGASSDSCISDTSGGTISGDVTGGTTITNSSSGGGGGVLSGSSAVGYQTGAGLGAAFTSNTPSGVVLGAATGPAFASGNPKRGSVLGEQTNGGSGNPAAGVTNPQSVISGSGQAAAAVLGLSSSQLLAFLQANRCFFAFIIMLLLMVGVWLALDSFGDYKNALPPKARALRRILYFIAGTAAALLIAIIFHLWCIITLLAVILFLLIIAALFAR
jgi:hypothetical protein